MAVSGGLALVCLIFLVVFLRGLVFALRLSADNEKNEGTETGGGSPFWRARNPASNSFWKGKEEPAFDEES